MNPARTRRRCSSARRASCSATTPPCSASPTSTPRPTRKASCAEYHLTYPNLRDNNGDFAHSYGTDQLPESFVIDRQGHIVAISRGEIDQPFLNRAIALAEAAHETPRAAARRELARSGALPRRSPRSAAALPPRRAARAPRRRARSLPVIERQVMCVTCKIPLDRRPVPAGQPRARVHPRPDRRRPDRSRRSSVRSSPSTARRCSAARAHGFDLTVYLVPLAAFLALLATLAVLLPRWRRHARAQAARAVDRARLDLRRRARLDADLARFD